MPIQTMLDTGKICNNTNSTSNTNDKTIFYSSEQSPLFRDSGVYFVLSSRLGGVSKTPYNSLNLGQNTGDNLQHIKQNRAQILSKYFPQKTLIFCNQVHSNTILTAYQSHDKNFTNENLLCNNLNNDLGNNGEILQYLSNQKLPNQNSQNLKEYLLKEQNLGQGDGIFCHYDKHIVALILVADCNPVLLFDRENNAFVAIHAGRAGVCQKILPNGVDKLLKNGAKIQNILVFIGASIRSCCYEVGGDLAEKIVRDFGTKYVEKREGKYFLDLVSMLLDECEEAGILPKNIEVLQKCSCCEYSLFSYRRAVQDSRKSAQDKTFVNSAKTGRFGLFVSFKKEF